MDSPYEPPQAELVNTGCQSPACKEQRSGMLIVIVMLAILAGGMMFSAYFYNLRCQRLVKFIESQGWQVLYGE